MERLSFYDCRSDGSTNCVLTRCFTLLPHLFLSVSHDSQSKSKVGNSCVPVKISDLV